ncbi:serine hydrolase domain-containing protein [Sphingomonas sp. S2-65]|uniref:serine hydrolase domain-containing protein n=1 Tax=Sphingomonas sp. S2-65 TaxID=2903960 RepID=UPI001F2884EF|nr:serine hydrolase domain-containing protein [Sphingomonas sp. S2-65]UYY58866.1 beta-lactamase family protein [Sphingomonas sp. S2-65]
MLQSRPGRYGFSAERLARIDAFLRERYLDSGRFPHAQLLIAHEGEIVHFSHQGPARENGAPVDEGTLFRIASMTKPITSLAFMMLVEEARVALDTPVHHVLPELKGVGVYAGGGNGAPFETRPTDQPMRMVDLLRHTAGLTYGFQEQTPVDAAYRQSRMERWHDNLTLDGFIAELGQLPLEYSPGTAWTYSVATDVLGAVIERVSGTSLDRFLHDRVFVPLGMQDTFFQVPADKIDHLADCWAVDEKTGEPMIYDRGAESAWSRMPRLLSGGGGLVSTAVDYHRFATLCLNGGELDGVRLVSPKTIELMTMNHLPTGGDLTSCARGLFNEASLSGTGFGLGFAVTIDVAKTLVPGTVGDYYWGGMFSTAFFVDPVERISMVFMTQFTPSMRYPVRRELKTMIHSALA